ncbi:4-hydroxybenzoate polyprenyltransferase [Desulfatibacillum alkenivorans DSM 16219]|uniref:4-hydroxybenzoate polyprenyltransferase n=2 Tax=Desulfatibacillum alkenivorans TaxID=259354 RepID=A0A1M6LX75_9BACT|nr:4-hydroxybenzoate polyprenyltransferase [Desulfatibacillum alkenivorans DSM 16219]
MKSKIIYHAPSHLTRITTHWNRFLIIMQPEKTTSIQVSHLRPGAGGEEPLFTEARNPAMDMLRAMRPHQWVKNFLVFVPVFTGHQVSLLHLSSGLAAFLCLSLCASALYLINDVLDLEADKIHPHKKNRPFASGALPPQFGLAAAPLLALAAMGCALWMPVYLAGTLIVYLVLGLNYSLWIKKIAFLDVLVLAVMYTLRIVAGGAAAGIPISLWLLIFSVLFFTSLAMAKRYVEAAALPGRNRSRAKGRGYGVGDEKILGALGAAFGIASIAVLCFYAGSRKAAELYRSPSLLWAGCALLLLWLGLLWSKARKGALSDDPIVFALKNKASLALLCAVGAVFIAAGWI